ncbi:MAG: oxygen-dependent coproporphyrinogen oxidase [Bacteroidetes bacterium]|jgi:coproporphyrinogen III oxidase|nr:oxygen-dependent coproporphyrinogen oxidase [Bacteroidota bacterium]
MNRETIVEELKALQDAICAALEQEDGSAKFEEELWDREGGGGGRTRIIRHGAVIEKGGVNFSAVHGQLPEVLVKELKLESADFFATGVSIVIHPNNPHVPIIHMNIRYFEAGQGEWWFGGGIDLTPHYIIAEQAQWFHEQLKNVCDQYDESYYPKFKKWADDYFFIKHRNETRGIGGVFFDRLNDKSGRSKYEIHDYWLNLGNTFVPIYVHLMSINKSKSFTQTEKNWQLIRRGRYVEFNLVYDRGTKFGLETNGRIESILMSLPELASWQYNYIPESHSFEEQTAQLLRKNFDWIGWSK